MGWNLVTSGDKEGMYVCSSNPTTFYWCYSIRDTANTKRYWCDVAKLIDTKPAQNLNQVVKIFGNGDEWSCATEGYLESYTLCSSSKNHSTYAGELI